MTRRVVRTAPGPPGDAWRERAASAPSAKAKEPSRRQAAAAPDRRISTRTHAPAWPRRRRTAAPSAYAPPWRWTRPLGPRDQPGEYASVEEPRPCPSTTPPSKRSRSARWRNCAAREPIPFPSRCSRRGPIAPAAARIDPVFRLPSTALLNEPPARNPYDEQELKDTASRDQGQVRRVQRARHRWCRSIPGPVVTTFEFKPEAGIKYSRITNSHRGSLPGPAGRIDPDRAHSGQADGRHRGAEHASAK